MWFSWQLEVRKWPTATEGGEGKKQVREGVRSLECGARMKTAPHKERLFDIFFKGGVRHREQEEMLRKSYGGGYWLRGQESVRGDSPAQEKKMEVRWWDEEDD